MNKENIRELAVKYLSGTATVGEEETLHQWYDTVPVEEETIIVTESEESQEALRERLLARILEEISEEAPPTALLRSIAPSRKWYWAVAAVATGLLVGGYFFFSGPLINNRPGEAQNNNVAIAAGGNKALLQLSDGRILVLDSAENGSLAIQGSTQVVKNGEGEIAYQAGESETGNLYNVLSTPAGGQYAITLPDGSRVWLNAVSSLRFPVHFSGNQRKVELTGEAYFEVTHQAEMPFVVSVGNANNPARHEVKVLGTHFNIRAYPGESEMKTTLLEGKVSVKIPSKGDSLVLLPGQQADIAPDGRVELNLDADMDEAISWHNGLFRFNKVKMEEIMLQAARWYDITVKYEGQFTEHFVSTIPRQASLAEFLAILEKTGRVKFRVEGKEVTVISVK